MLQDEGGHCSHQQQEVMLSPERHLPTPERHPPTPEHHLLMPEHHLSTPEHHLLMPEHQLLAPDRDQQKPARHLLLPARHPPLPRRASVRAPPLCSGWWRALRLCLLAVLLPSLLVAGPLYLRYRVYYATMYPLGLSDMRLINSHVSTTWCQGQRVSANTTYNAYVVDGGPRVSLQPQRVSMARQLVLEDDMKEYWAFYLLAGSSVTVSTCVRFQGASLIVVKGHRHLRECAYIGDDSSEEDDELLEAAGSSGEPANKTNTPDLMRRFRPGVQLAGGEAARGSRERLGASGGGGSSDEEDTLLASLLLRQARRLRTRPTATPTPQPSSGEVVEELVKRVRELGPRAREVLARLAQEEEAGGGRARREVLLNPGRLADHDEEADAAMEEELDPDGIADHHRTLNQTTAGDRSNSEVWSSFSSSEEKLLQCAGLVLNLPLQPHHRCEAHRSADEHRAAAQPNTITYKVPSNGYYFFVFRSENEIQPNYIRIHFHLEKMVYNVSHAVASCRNTTGLCSLPLGFWTSDTVVLEVPIGSNTSLWNEEFFAQSECQPRTAIYLACIVAVPLLILLFAFH